MIQPPGRRPLGGIAAGKVFQCGPVAFGRGIAVGLPVNLKHMTKGVFKAKGAAMAQIALNPAMNGIARGADRLNTPLQ